MTVHSPRCLEQARLDVVDKTRSNMFNWRGQFTPQLVEYLLDTYAESTDVSFDPFCGSGTVLLESARRNIKSVAYEISPAAYAMAKFLTLSTLTHSDREELFESVKAPIDGLIGSYPDLPIFDIHGEFRDRYRNLLGFAADLFAKTETKTETLLALVILFHAENNHKGYLAPAILRACKATQANLMALPHTTVSLSAELCDARLSHRHQRSSTDIIITSPPYINVFNYHQNYRALLEVLGFNLLKIAESEIGSNRKNRGNRFRTVVQYALDMEQALLSFAQSLRQEGLLILIVGRESRVRGIPFSNSSILKEIALSSRAYELESQNERLFLNRFGQHIKEDILILRQSHPPTSGTHAREIARRHLESTLGTASGEVKQDIVLALSNVETIQPSPFLNGKEMI